MKRSTGALLSILMAFVLICSMAGKAAAQEAVENADSDSEMLLLDDAEGDFKAFASTCTLKVFPESIRSRRLGRFGMFIVSEGEESNFERGDTVDWGTDDINTILQFRFPRRIFSLVWIQANAEVGLYEVTVGDDNCTGTLEIR